MAKNYISVVQDMSYRTGLRCAAGVTEMFKVEVGPHQVSALSCFLFTRVINRLTDEVRWELLWT